MPAGDPGTCFGSTPQDAIVSNQGLNRDSRHLKNKSRHPWVVTRNPHPGAIQDMCICMFRGGVTFFGKLSSSQTRKNTTEIRRPKNQKSELPFTQDGLDSLSELWPGDRFLGEKKSGDFVVPSEIRGAGMTRYLSFLDFVVMSFF